VLLTVFGICRAATLPVGGWCADRLGARRVMLAADLGRAGALGAFTVLAWTPGASVWALMAVAGVLGLGEGCFNPAALSVLPGLVPRAALQTANAVYQAGMQIVGISAPALGGLVVAAVRPGGALLADTATFLLSAVTLAMIGAHRVRRPAEEVAVPLEHVDGAAPRPALLPLLRGDTLLRATLLAALASSLVVGGVLEVALPVLATGPIGEGSTGYGVLLAGFSAGSLLGALVASRIGGRATGPAAFMAIAAFGPALAGIAAAGSWRGSGGLGTAFAFTLVAGAGPTFGNVLLLTLFQHRIPEAALGRVMAVMLAANMGLFALSAPLASLGITAMGVKAYMAVAGAVVTCCALATLASASVRHVSLTPAQEGSP